MTGGKALGGKGGKGFQQGKVGEDLREEKREDLRGGKAKGGERISAGKGVEKISGRGERP